MGVHAGLPQTPLCPPPPHVSPDGHVPHASCPPHPSPAGPQLKPWAAHVRGMHAPLSMAPHCPFAPPPPQVWSEGHVPHARVPPQPSPAGPHAMFCAAHVVGWQQEPPQTLGLPSSPPPHTWQPTVQVPQSSVPPQPSEGEPQLAPSCAQVAGVHVPVLHTPPPQD